MLPAQAPTPTDDATSLRHITILAVDDHPLMIEGIASVLAGEPGMRLVAHAANGPDALERCRQWRPDVVLMDIQLREQCGLEFTKLILQELPQIRVIVLTTYEGDGYAMRAVQAGAAGYLLKSMLRHELATAIRNVHAGRKNIAVAFAMDMLQFGKNGLLTSREVVVLQHVAAGLSNKRTGAALNIAEDTVKTHMKSILSKLGATDRAHAVAIGIQRGIVRLPLLK